MHRLVVLLILLMTSIGFPPRLMAMDATARDAAVAQLDFADYADNDGWVAPVATDLGQLPVAKAAEFRVWWDRVSAWANAHDGPAAQVHAYLVAAALTDIGRSPWEAETARSAFDHLRATYPAAELRALVAEVAVGPMVAPPTTIPALGLRTTMTAEQVHARTALYARKLLGRLLNQIPW